MTAGANRLAPRATAPHTPRPTAAVQPVENLRAFVDARRQAAERLLADASLAVSQIGYLLGFSEPSAFHRAFRRWHNVTPQEYRSARHG